MFDIIKKGYLLLFQGTLVIAKEHFCMISVKGYTHPNQNIFLVI